MKHIKLILLSVLLMAIGVNSFSAIILSEDFTDGPATYTTGSFTFNSGNSWELASILGTAEVKYQLNTDAFIISPAVNTIGTITFKYKEGNSGGGSFTVSKSVDGGAFTTIESKTFAGTTYTTYSVTINDLSDNIRIKVSANAGSQLIIDDFEITDYAVGSLLTTSTPSLSGFDYFAGEGPSTSKFFDLSGILLTGYPGNIVVTAPTDYEVSLNNSTFTSSINVAYSSASLPETTIYVRLKIELPVGNYNLENISIAGGGADAINVSCSGSVTEMPPAALYAFPTALSGFTYVFGLGPSAYQTYELYGNYLTGYPSDIAISAPSDYEISLDNSTYLSSLNVPYTSSTLASTTIYVRLKEELSIGNYNSENITNTGGGYGTVTVTCSGTVEDLPPDPSLYVNPSTLSGFNYIVGSALSTPQSYQLSGTNLTGYPDNITISALTNYKVSLSEGSGYSSSINVPYASSSLASTTIYVRLELGLSVGTYNSEIVSNVGGGASTINVTCNGSVSEIPPPSLIVTPSTLNGFTYIEENGPSDYQSYTISGTYLTGYPDDITLGAPTNYEISLSSGGAYTTSIDIPYSSATLNATTIYVRLKEGRSIGTYNSETIANSGGGATVNVTCNGNVTAVPPATLSVSPSSLSGFSYIVGFGPSTEQSYNLSGTNLTGYPGNITVSGSTNYEISLNSGGVYTTSIDVPYSSTTLNSTIIYVRLKEGFDVGSYNSQFITNAGGGAVDVDVSCSGSISDVSTDPCLAEDFSGFTAGTHASPNGTDYSSSLDSYTQTTGWTGLKIYSAGGEIKIGSSSASGYIITPTIDLSSGGTLEFDYAQWASDASVVQIFHAADGVTFVQIGTDLSPTTAFQSTSIEITGGTANSKIKIGTNIKRCYLDNLEIYCGGSTPTPILAADPVTLSGFNYIEGSVTSDEQSFILTGTDLDGSNVTITAATNYKISLSSGSGFQSTPITLVAFDGSSTTIYTRLKLGLTAGTYNSETISITGGGASVVIVTCNGTVGEAPNPAIYTNPTTLNEFTYIEGFGPSDEQSFILTGEELDGTDVIITPPIDYEISLSSGTDFQITPIVLPAYDGTATTIFVRLKDELNFGLYNTGNIAIVGGGTTGITISCNGQVDEYVKLETFNIYTDINIYPNPCSDILNISISNWDSKTINIEVINMLGQVIYSDKLNNTLGVALDKIDTNYLRSGMYYIRFSDTTRSITRKFSK